MEDDASQNFVTPGDWLLTCVIAVGLAIGVWWGLVTGGGLVGGDTYTYFLPQKMVLAEAFEAGEVPLWHAKTGLGYPLLAESQAGVFYPPNQLLYRLLDVNTAYNWGMIGHYCFAFIFAWRFGRCQSLGNAGALLAALVFVYGWFPARVSHEWSIVGGVWFPLTLWLLDQLLKRWSGRIFVLLALSLAMHLLAGHFTLAFINQLTLVAYAFLKTITADRSSREWRKVFLPVAAIVLGLGCASVQLLPTYELKLSSQRHGEQQKFDPAFGHMPPAYATQLFASWWYWHTPEMLQSKAMMQTPGVVAADSNHVEAHLYWGLIPFTLCVLTLTAFRRRVASETVFVWSLLIAVSIVYATGWLMPLARHLPGFGFFNGPGRYTMIAALGGGIVAGLGFDALTARSSRWATGLVLLLVGGLTLWDLMLSSRYVADSIVVAEPPIRKLESSWVRKAMLRNEPSTKRLLAPGPNIANFFGVSSVPQYLGIGPAVYYDDLLLPKTGPDSQEQEFPTAENVVQWQQLGITHLLTTEAIPRPSPAITLVQQYPDTLLNAVWGRGQASCFLYEFTMPSGRITTSDPEAITGYLITNTTPNTFEFEVEMAEPSSVVLKELMYPGWNVYVDGEQQRPIDSSTDSFFRCVDVSQGRHTVKWSFEPTSFRLGVWASGTFLCIASLIFIWRGRNTNVREREAS